MIRPRSSDWFLIACSIIYIHDDQPYPGWRALAPTIGAALVLWSGARSRIIAPVLSSGPFVFVGKISYPLYLWHWPVFWLYRTVATPDFSLNTATELFAVSFALAWLTYQFVEKPIRFGPASPFTPKWLVACLFVAAGTGLITSRNGLPGRWPAEIITLLTYKFDDSIFRIGKCHLKPEQGPSDFAEECFSQRTPGAKHVVLWGDSAVTAIEPGLQSLNNGRLNIALPQSDKDNRL